MMRDLRSLTLVFALRFFYLASSFLLSSAITKILDVSAFGSFSISQAVVLMVYSFAIAGVPTLIVRETASENDSANEVATGRVVRSLLKWVVAGGVLTLTVALILLGVFGADRIVLVTSAIGLPAILMLGLSVVMNSVLRGKNRVFESQIGDMFLRPAIYLSLVFLIRVGVAGLVSPAVVMVAFDVATFVALIFSYSRFRTLTLIGDPEEKTLGAQATWQPLKQLASIDLIHAVSLYSPTIVIGFVAAERDVALFRIAFQISLLLPTGLYVANAIYYPRMCELFKGRRVEQVELICRKCCLVGFVFAVLVAVMLGLCGKSFISFFFDDRYLDSIPVLVALGAVQLLNAFTGPLDLVLTAANLEKLLMRTRGAALLFQVPALAIGAHLYGAIGAAVAYGIAFLVWNVVLWCVVYHRLGIIAFPSISALQLRTKGS